MRRLTLYLAASFLILSATSCDKEDGLDVMETNATLYWSGDYAVDGCGFSIELNKQRYKPENEQDISSSFKKDEPTSVKLKYTLPEKKISYNCGLAIHEAAIIRVLSVKALH